jgi:hypothetical protein
MGPYMPCEPTGVTGTCPGVLLRRRTLWLESMTLLSAVESGPVPRVIQRFDP